MLVALNLWHECDGSVYMFSVQLSYTYDSMTVSHPSVNLNGENTVLGFY